MIKQKALAYRENNKDKIALKNQRLRLEHHEEYLERARKYRHENKDKIRGHYEANKHIINEKRKVSTICDICGACYRKADKTRHEKTQKHIQVLNTLRI